MKKTVLAPLAACALLLGAGAAHAGNVSWSIGINLPPVATVVTSAPVYAPAYVAPPVVYAPPPPPVYVPPPVVYAPRVVYPAPVVYGPPHGWRDRDRDGIPDRWDRHDDRWRHHQPVPRYYHDRDRDGVPDRWDRWDGRRGR